MNREATFVHLDPSTSNSFVLYRTFRSAQATQNCATGSHQAPRRFDLLCLNRGRCRSSVAPMYVCDRAANSLRSTPNASAIWHASTGTIRELGHNLFAASSGARASKVSRRHFFYRVQGEVCVCVRNVCDLRTLLQCLIKGLGSTASSSTSSNRVFVVTRRSLSKATV